MLRVMLSERFCDATIVGEGDWVGDKNVLFCTLFIHPWLKIRPFDFMIPIHALSPYHFRSV